MKMINKKITLLCVILLVLPLIYAGNTNLGIYGVGLYGANDTDMDMIPDYVDNLLYNATYVTITGITELNITTDGNNSHGSFNESQEVIIYDQTDALVNFTYNFSKSVLDLSKVEIQKTSTYIIVNFSGQLELNKTLYLADNSFDSLCIKNKEISSISEMSSTCTGDNETDFTTCLGNTGVTLNGINCTDEGTIIRVENLLYSAIRGTTSSVIPPYTPVSPGGGGISEECSLDAHCGVNHYCFENKCYDYECFDDSVCEDTETCWNGRCVKLFDIEILDFESPISLGEFFSFGYFIKGMADFNHDVEVNFQIEKDGEVISSGKDTIYLGSFDEKTKTSKLFLPSDITSGKYIFSITVSFEHYKVESHRTIEISVEEGIARIGLDAINGTGTYIIFILSVLSIILFGFILHLERKKIKSVLIEEQKWIKKHRISILTFFLFVILGILGYYCGLYKTIANWISLIPWKNISPYIYYLFGAIIALTLLIIIILKKRKKIIKKIKIKMPKKRSRKVKVQKEKTKKMKMPEKKIKLPKIKIKPVLIKMSVWIVKYKKTLLIILLLAILGILVYLIFYFRWHRLIPYASISNFFINIGSWIKNNILPYIYYIIGAIVAIAVLIILIILRKKIKKKIKNIPIPKVNLPKKQIKLSQRQKDKIKSVFKRFGKWIIKHKIPVMISLLVAILGFFVYYLGWYEIIANRATAFANWISSIAWNKVLPYIYYTLGALVALGVLVLLAILAKKKGWYKSFKKWLVLFVRN